MLQKRRFFLLSWTKDTLLLYNSFFWGTKGSFIFLGGKKVSFRLEFDDRHFLLVQLWRRDSLLPWNTVQKTVFFSTLDARQSLSRNGKYTNSQLRAQQYLDTKSRFPQDTKSELYGSHHKTYFNRGVVEPGKGRK